MKVYGYMQACQDFPAVLNAALNESVIISAKDGSKFSLSRINAKAIKSPLDIDCIGSNISRQEIVDIINENRQRKYLVK
ncbi:MAG: prevent-host-death protein [Elusimicrobiota bacterium]|jgi:hypothetical protein|nr:prevent-host-death protein [Elusimicrobiota bacterium]